MEIPLNELRKGDCISGMNALPEGCVDLVFADPPFNIGYSYDVYADSLDQSRYLQWSREWIKAVHRVLKPDGTFWLAIGDENAAELKLESQKIGFACRSWVIWYYTFGVNCVKKFTRSHAHLFYFVKNPGQFTFNSDDPCNRIPSARQLVYADGRANPKGRLPDDTWLIRPHGMAAELSDDSLVAPFEAIVASPDREQTWILRPQDLSECFSPEENTWYFPRVAGTFKERAGFHGCQMPEQLLGRIIRLCSNPRELVLDPFSGSATTLTVAKKLGRRYLGFDLSPDYVQYGRGRLGAVHPGDPLEGSAEPTLSAPKTGSSPAESRAKNRSSPADFLEAKGRQADEINKQKQQEELHRGITEAYARIHSGFSPDRVVADPELNALFMSECRRLGLLGNPRVWNTLLFRLRKAGKLIEFPTTQSTSMSWEDCDEFLYASEIALEVMLKNESARSVDEILCDPTLAREFDERAATFAPGFLPLQYRWAALKLRKQAKLARSRGSVLKVPTKLPSAIGLDDAGALERLCDAPGIYLVTGADEKCLYVGETISLRQRLRTSFESEERIRPWIDQGGSKTLTIIPFQTDSPIHQMLAWQSCFVRKYKTPLNFRELRAAQ
jgi:site-specific DNA-methyltransferase (adenine-specific)